jgi:hypothetical protein
MSDSDTDGASGMMDEFVKLGEAIRRLGISLNPHQRPSISTYADYQYWMADLKHQMPLGIELCHVAIMGPLGKLGWFWRWLERLSLWILKKRGMEVIHYEIQK